MGAFISAPVFLFGDIQPPVQINGYRVEQRECEWLRAVDPASGQEYYVRDLGDQWKLFPYKKYGVLDLEENTIVISKIDPAYDAWWAETKRHAFASYGDIEPEKAAWYVYYKEGYQPVNADLEDLGNA